MGSQDFARIPYLIPLRDGRLVLEFFSVLMPEGHLPGGSFQAVVAMSDLQGAVIRDPRTGQLETQMLSDPSPPSIQELESVVRDLDLRLEPLGVVLPEHLARWLEREGVDPSRVLVLLAGDLCGVLERGATCDVRPVWEAFARHFRYVVGVTGNHDLLDKPPEGMWLLDADVLNLEGVKIGGVSGIVGRQDRNPRNRDARAYREVLEKVLSHRPEILLVHPCPDVGEFSGNAVVAEVLKGYPASLHVVCGHVPWPRVRVRLGSHVVVWNVDHRALCFRGNPRHDLPAEF